MIPKPRFIVLAKLLSLATILLITVLSVTVVADRQSASAQSAGDGHTFFLPLVQSAGNASGSGNIPQELFVDENAVKDVDEDDSDADSDNPEDELPALVVGGHQAYRGQFPFMVSTRHNNGHICGGTLIAPKFVLTAHHCFFNKSSNITVALGAHSISGSDASQIIPVRKLHFYPATTIHQQTNGGHDIMILELSYAATLNSRVQTLPYNTNASFGLSGTTRAHGWGATCQNCGGAAYLKYVDMPINGRAWNQWQIDAGRTFSYQTTCFGDSGGPYTKGGQLIGVTSYTYGPSATQLCSGNAGITDVAIHASWIQQIVGSNAQPNPTPRPTPTPTPRPFSPQPQPQPSNNCLTTNMVCMFEAANFKTHQASVYQPGQNVGYWMSLKQISHTNGTFANRISSVVNNTTKDALLYDKEGFRFTRVKPGATISYLQWYGLENSVDYVYLCPNQGCLPYFP